MNTSSQLATTKSGAGLPPILAGNLTPDIKKRVEQFYFSGSQLF
jgi:hypothetical protein